jgi:hypothetical protein
MRGVEENEDKKTFILVSSPLAWGKPGAQAARIDAKIEAKKKVRRAQRGLLETPYACAPGW